jgi:hypothetical protein
MRCPGTLARFTQSSPGERGRALPRRLSRRRVLGHHSSLGGMLPARFSPTSGQLSHRV